MSWDRRFSTTWACFKRLLQIRMLLAHMMFHTLHWLCWKPSSRRKLPRRPSTSCGTSWKRQPRFWEKTLKLETSQLLRFADGKFAICLNGLMCSVYLFFLFVDIFPMSHIPWYFTIFVDILPLPVQPSGSQSSHVEAWSDRKTSPLIFVYPMPWWWTSLLEWLAYYYG